MTLLGAIMSGSANNPVAPPAFNPLTTPGWYAAYWASDPDWSNPGNGGTLTSWRDGSGNGRNLTSVSGTPIWRSTEATLGGNSIVEFTDDAIGLPVASFGNVTQPFSIVAILKLDNADSSTDSIIDAYSETANQRTLFRKIGSLWNIHSGLGVDGSTTINTNPHLFTCYISGASSVVEMDGVTEISGNAGTRSLGGLTLMGNAGGTASSSSSKFAFVGIYSGGDVRAQSWWSDFENWVESYYGISIS